MMANDTISKAQGRVLERMRNGWQLGLSTALHSRWWLQKGGCGRGGESENVNAGTALALLRRELIQVDKQGFPLTTYRLSDD